MPWISLSQLLRRSLFSSLHCSVKLSLFHFGCQVSYNLSWMLSCLRSPFPKPLSVLPPQNCGWLQDKSHLFPIWVFYFPEEESSLAVTESSRWSHGADSDTEPQLSGEDATDGKFFRCWRIQLGRVLRWIWNVAFRANRWFPAHSLPPFCPFIIN